MATVNDNYLKLQAGYLFPEIGRRVGKFVQEHPSAKIIKLGIGDVVLPLTPTVVKAFHEGVDEMAKASTFRGYGPEQGHEFLRKAIAENDFAHTDIQGDEIFISDGSKCDCGNVQEIFDRDIKVAISDPVYPVYLDTNVMAGRTGECGEDGRFAGVYYMPLTEENGFAAALPEEKVDLIYLCSPNNPTGVAMTRDELRGWVDYARANDSIVLFDAAYERFITNPEVPHSIFEIEGARECAIETRSFSKSAGFTGVRCACLVIPKELRGKTRSGEEVSIHDLWSRRHTTKFNGTSYPVQVAAAAIYTPEGKKETDDRVAYYMENAKLIRERLNAKGMKTFGGINCPYVWLKTPEGVGSWELFDKLLGECHIVGTPGAGFGPSGEGYFRISAFGTRENVVEALGRIETQLDV